MTAFCRRLSFSTAKPPQHTHTPVPWKGTTRERCCRFKCTKARQRTCQGQTLVEPVGKDGREDGWCGPVGEAPCVICCGNGGKTHRKMATDPKRESTVYSPPSTATPPLGSLFAFAGFTILRFIYVLRGVFQPPSPSPPNFHDTRFLKGWAADKCMRLLAETRQKVFPSLFPNASCIRNGGRWQPCRLAFRQPGLSCACVQKSACDLFVL